MLPQAGAERVSTAAAAGTVTKRREGEEKKRFDTKREYMRGSTE